MPRRRKRTSTACSICKHEHRALIEGARVAGASLDSIAGKYGCSRDALHRHCKNHLSDDQRSEYLAAVPLRELAEKAAAEGLSILQYLSLTRGILVKQMQLASSVNDHHATSALAGRLNETNRLIGAITGEMGALAANHVNITNNNLVLQEHPYIMKMQAVLLRALEDEPEARAKVVAALRSLDAENAPARPAASSTTDVKLIEMVPS